MGLVFPTKMSIVSIDVIALSVCVWLDSINGIAYLMKLLKMFYI